MNIKKAFGIMVCAAVMAAVWSCKDDDETEYYYLDGTLVINGSQRIISPGDSLFFTPSGLENIEDLEVLYRWTVTDKEDTDTSRREDGGWGYRFPEGELKTYTIKCYTTCTGYQSSGASAYVTTVAAGPDGSIPEIYEGSGSESVSDAEGNVYSIAKAGGLWWTTRNLAVTSVEDNGEKTAAGVSYYGYAAMDGIAGRYYTYDEALKVCPEGWRLPSDSDWMSAAATVNPDIEVHTDWKDVSGAFMKYATFNGVDLWEFWPDVKVTNSTGIQAIPLGFYTVDENSFSGLYNQAVFWTSDEVDSERAYVRYIVAEQPDMFCMAAYKSSFGASVRCVKDAE